MGTEKTSRGAEKVLGERLRDVGRCRGGSAWPGPARPWPVVCRRSRRAVEAPSGCSRAGQLPHLCCWQQSSGTPPGARSDLQSLSKPRSSPGLPALCSGLGLVPACRAFPLLSLVSLWPEGCVMCRPSCPGAVLLWVTILPQTWPPLSPSRRFFGASHPKWPIKVVAA